MKILTFDEIVSADDLKKEFVATPEWADGDEEAGVYVREMTGSERDAWESQITKQKGDKVEVNRENFRATLLVRCVVNDQGDRLFHDKQVEVLGRKGAATISRLFDVAMRINGISKSDQDELVAAKNSEEEAGDTSSSPSVSN